MPNNPTIEEKLAGMSGEWWMKVYDAAFEAVDAVRSSEDYVVRCAGIKKASIELTPLFRSAGITTDAGAISRDELEGAVLKEIDSRDKAQDALQEAHIALGGDGEWVCRIPEPSPPGSGDLHRDVPELARQLRSELTRSTSDSALVAKARELAKEIGVVREGDCVAFMPSKEDQIFALVKLLLAPPETSSADCRPVPGKVPSSEKPRPGSAGEGGETALQIIESKIREYEGGQSPPAWMLLLQFKLTYGSESAANLAKLRTRLGEMRGAHLHKDDLGPAITIGRVLFEIDAIYGKATP